MSRINVRDFFNENEDGAPDLVGITTFSATSYFVPTRGTTAQRPSDHVEVGSLRYNYDTKNLEFYRGKTIGWASFELIDPDLGGGTGSNTGLGVRGIFAGGYANGVSPTTTNSIDFVTISTLGNAQEFGDLTSGADQDIVRCGSSRTRGVFRDGNSAPMTFITFASTGNSASFGNSGLTENRANGFSSETRGLHAGGTTSNRNQIEYITIASTGNAVDFGNLITGAHSVSTGASSTRGIFAGCATHPANSTNAIEYVTISTLGNSQDFGDLVNGGFTYMTNSSSNSTKMLATADHSIEQIIIATLGDGTDFGDLTNNVDSRGGGCSSPTRALFGGGSDPAVNIEYVEFASTGDAVDFGDLTYVQNRHGCGTSNGHGGL